MKALGMLALLALAGRAYAGDKEKADTLFKEGKKLMGEKRFADACRAFDESFKLDPGIGGELNIAKCYEEWGKLGRAYRAYQKAEDLANEAHDPRLSKIHELVTAIEGQVPHLQIHLPPDADTAGLVISIDGVVVDAADLANPQLVDPGPHQVEWKLGEGKKKNKIVPVERGETSQLTIDVPAKKKVEPAHEKKVDKPPVVSESAPADPGRTQKFLAYGAVGVGAVAIGVSAVMAFSARSKYKTALDSHCMGQTNMCDPTGITDTRDARHSANIATIVFVVGAAAVGGGVALYLTAPRAHAKKETDEEHALRIVPVASPDGAGVVLGGRF